MQNWQIVYWLKINDKEIKLFIDKFVIVNLLQQQQKQQKKNQHQQNKIKLKLKIEQRNLF